MSTHRRRRPLPQMQKAACGTVDLLVETVVEMAPGPDKIKLSRMIAETVPSMLNQARLTRGASNVIMRGHEALRSPITVAILSQAGSKAKGSVREPGRKTFELIMAKAYSKRALDLAIAHGVQHASYLCAPPGLPACALRLLSRRALLKRGSYAQRARGDGQRSRDSPGVYGGGAQAGPPQPNRAGLRHSERLSPEYS